MRLSKKLMITVTVVASFCIVGSTIGCIFLVKTLKGKELSNSKLKLFQGHKSLNDTSNYVDDKNQDQSNKVLNKFFSLHKQHVS